MAGLSGARLKFKGLLGVYRLVSPSGDWGPERLLYISSYYGNGFKLLRHRV